MIGSYTAPKEHGILVVFSGPSGAGKGTILKRYFEDDPPAVLSVSATTRAPRPGEVDGVHYHFISRAEFEQLIANDGVLEYNIYNGNYYGSPAAPSRRSSPKVTMSSWRSKPTAPAISAACSPAPFPSLWCRPPS